MEIINRKAKFEYEILDKFEAGIVLTGTEIKSIRNGNANIKDSYAIIKNGEVFLLNMFISEYKEGNIFNHEETRTRKLLLHKNEIRKINDKIKIKGLTIVPLKVYFVRGKAKVEIAIARGKHTYDKKETIKQRDIDREIIKRKILILTFSLFYTIILLWACIWFRQKCLKLSGKSVAPVSVQTKNKRK